MKQQLYIKKGRKYLPIDNKLSQYEEDCIWMSYRYCVGRHTIAAHMHAGEIAVHAYGRMSDERTQFMSKDINREIAHILNIHNWFEFDNEWSIPESEYRPLDLLYRCLDEANIHSDEELRKIKNITAIYENINNYVRRIILRHAIADEKAEYAWQDTHFDNTILK